MKLCLDMEDNDFEILSNVTSFAIRALLRWSSRSFRLSNEAKRSVPKPSDVSRPSNSPLPWFRYALGAILTIGNEVNKE